MTADAVKAAVSAEQVNWIKEVKDGFVTFHHSDGGRRTLTIAAMSQLEARIQEESGLATPPVLILDFDIKHAELDEISQMCEGRPLSDFTPWGRALAAIEAYPSVVLAAIGAQATAGGLELALACDITIASPSALLGLPEIRMGIIPGAGGTQRLPRRIGTGPAALLIFTGQAIVGDEAHRLGLVDVLAEHPLSRASELAVDLVRNGLASLVEAKRALIASRTMPLAEGLREEGRAFLKLVRLPETRERLENWRLGREQI